MWFLGLAWRVVMHRGLCEEAVKLFQQLVLGREAEPNEATIVNVLSACSSICGLSSGQQHAGLVDQGLMFFNAMKKVYCIVPETQYHACLVYMYGQGGLSEEAEALLKMPTKVDGPVWGVLLSACKIHGSEKMVERIKQGLPNNGSEHWNLCSVIKCVC